MTCVPARTAFPQLWNGVGDHLILRLDVFTLADQRLDGREVSLFACCVQLRRDILPIKRRDQGLGKTEHVQPSLPAVLNEQQDCSHRLLRGLVYAVAGVDHTSLQSIPTRQKLVASIL